LEAENLCAETKTFYDLMAKISAHLEFGSNYEEKVGTGPHLPQCTSPLLLTTVCKHLETEETCCWTFWKSLLCRVLHFMMYQMFSVGENSELQTGQSITRTILLRSHAFVKDAVCGLALSGRNMQGLPHLKKINTKMLL